MREVMKIEVTERLESKAYEFLKNEKALGDRILYLVVSGSYGYGTQYENSDIDLRGCTIEGKEVLFGLESFEQYEDLHTDTVIFGLKKFVRLGLNANPQTLELLGIDEDCIYQMTPQGKLLRDNTELFLSQKVADTFGGYAMAQLRRLQNALAQNSASQVLKEQHIAATLSRQIKQFNDDYTSFDKGSIVVYVDEESQDLRTTIHLEDYPLRDFTSIYANMTNTIKSYEKLTHRNHKKEESKLYKHAMHLVRILITGTYILEGKGIRTRLEEHLPTLLSIRHGEYSWDQIFKIVDSCEKHFNKAAQLTKLPERPQLDKVQKLIESIYESYYYK